MMKKTFCGIFLLVMVATQGNGQPVDIDSLIRDAGKRKDSAALINYFITKVKEQGDSALLKDKMWANNILYNYFFTYSGITRRQLKKSISYIKIIRKEELTDELGKLINAGFMDTHANLLYRLGKKKEALQLEADALQHWPDNRDIQNNYEKMKNGNHTW